MGGAVSKEKIKTLEKLAEVVKELKAVGKKIVFTNGCFDIIHRGHVEYLEDAKRLGDILVVAVNSDVSVRRLKGDGKPINTEYDRIRVLAGLECVDYVTIFDEDTPEAAIFLLKPHVLVKGSDWNIKKIVGKKFVESSGGKVVTIPFVEGYSTKGTIESILEKCKNRTLDNSL